jgi:hypothetical protein
MAEKERQNVADGRLGRIGVRLPGYGGNRTPECGRAVPGGGDPHGNAGDALERGWAGQMTATVSA